MINIAHDLNPGAMSEEERVNPDLLTKQGGKKELVLEAAQRKKVGMYLRACVLSLSLSLHALFLPFPFVFQCNVRRASGIRSPLQMLFFLQIFFPAHSAAQPFPLNPGVCVSLV